MRAVLYARYSTDKQRETSIDDQLRCARERAAREGWTVVATHADEGISGSVPVALRPGGKALLADALAGRFDVLVLEGLDRLSREVGEAETMVKRLEHRGVRIIGTADGYDSAARGRKVMRIARGLVNELYLDDLREKTHRGLAGQFERGLHVGGLSYGYRSVDVAGGRRLQVDDAKADVVREIFARYADGASTRSIVHALNARGVPGPRGGAWAITALHVSHTRGLGLLHNELYIGRETWNRRQWIKDPDTGKRRYVDRPRHEWQVRELPELRIVDQAVWDRCQQRIAARDGLRSRQGRGRAPRTLLAGLLVCAACGGPVNAIDAYRYGCGRARDRGPSVCAGVAVARQAVERRLLAEVRTALLDPGQLVRLASTARRPLGARRSECDVEAQRRRLHGLQAEIGRLVDAVAQLGLSDALRARLRAAEEERDQLERQLRAGTPTPAVTVDQVVAGWRRKVLELQQALEAAGDRDQARAALAALLGTVRVGMDDAGVYAELEEPAERLMVAAAGSVGVVAGGCNSSYRRVRIA